VNLMGNGIKFTQDGEVVLRVAPESGGAETAADTTTCHFTVTDTGIGIPLEQQQAIFAPFMQGDSSTTRLYGGTGLGLAISSRLVGMMKRRMWVASEPGKWSAFHFTAQFGLRNEVAQEQAGAGSAGPAVGSAARKNLSVLLVE